MKRIKKVIVGRKEIQKAVLTKKKEKKGFNKQLREILLLAEENTPLLLENFCNVEEVGYIGDWVFLDKTLQKKFETLPYLALREDNGRTLIFINSNHLYWKKAPLKVVLLPSFSPHSIKS